MARQPSLPTLKDVAEHAGVSPTTASMALSGRTGSAHLSPACIARVQRSAKALGYRGNYHARTLSSGRSLTLGLAVGSGPVSVLSHRFWSPICGGVESAARAHGLDVLLIGGADMLDPLERGMHHLEARRLDALIVLRNLYPSLPTALLRSRQPIVLLDDSGEHDPILPRVAFDDVPGIEAAVAHLAGLGHRDVLWLGNRDADGSLGQRRRATFTAAARRHGITARHHACVADRGDPEGDQLQAGSFLEPLRDFVPPRTTTAIMCWNESIALALYAALARHGVAVPDDISVVGFDDLVADVAQPELTTVSHACAALGRRTVELAVELVAATAPRRGARVETVPSHLVVRASTGPVRTSP